MRRERTKTFEVAWWTPTKRQKWCVHRGRNATKRVDAGISGIYHSYMNKRAEMRVVHAREVVTSKPLSDEALMIALMRAARNLEQKLEVALEPAGLSGPKFVALSHLVRADEPLSLGEFAARLTCVRSNITQLVDRLEADGLVRRIHDRSDRRGIRAMVTPLGIERQLAGAKLVERVKKQFAKSIAHADRDALARALSALE
jgi:DNA-binding MarR family transcriptional regulator